jgi:putative addiction module antidote
MSSEALTIRAIGNSSGVVLPKELLDSLSLTQGDRLFVTRTADGFVLRPYDAQFAEQMAVAREVMKRRRHVLRELAK